MALDRTRRRVRQGPPSRGSRQKDGGRLETCAAEKRHVPPSPAPRLGFIVLRRGVEDAATFAENARLLPQPGQHGAARADLRRRGAQRRAGRAWAAACWGCRSSPRPAAAVPSSRPRLNGGFEVAGPCGAGSCTRALGGGAGPGGWRRCFHVDADAVMKTLTRDADGAPSTTRPMAAFEGTTTAKVRSVRLDRPTTLCM